MPNSDGTQLEVVIFDPDTGEPTAEFTGEDAVDYVSLVSPGTYGPPALVSPATPGMKRSDVEDEVLYINTGFIKLWAIRRVRV
jgi:hypothetical protein